MKANKPFKQFSCVDESLACSLMACYVLQHAVDQLTVTGNHSIAQRMCRC